MKTIIKRIGMLAAMLQACLAVSAYDFEVDGIYYNVLSLQDMTCNVTKGTNEYTGNIVIPSTVEYQSRKFSVTAIGEKAFNGCNGLTSIILPEGLTKISSYAFYGCTGITSLSIPHGLTEIGGFAFDRCTNLTSISFSEGLKTINWYAFSDCTSLESISLPIGVREIGERAFSRCTNLKSASFQKGLVSIGKYIFKDCTNLTSVNLPDGMTTIETLSFADCTGLESITLPSSITQIGEYAFYGCTGLSSISLPEGLTKIDYKAFYGCTGLKSISLPNNITKIDGNVFENCSNLRSIIFEDNQNQVNIGSQVFKGCNSLEWLIFPRLCVISSAQEKGYDYVIPKCNLKYFKYGDICITGDSRRRTYFMEDTENCEIGTMEIGNTMRCAMYEYDNTYYKMNFTVTPEVLILNQEYNDRMPQLNVDKQYGHWYTVGMNGGFKKLISKCLEPPTIPCPVSDYQFMHTEVQVPIESLEKYQEAPVWKDFWNLKGVEEFDEIVDGINETDSDLIKTEIGRYDLTGKAVAEDYRGIVIVRYSDGSTSKMVQR